MWRYLHGIFTLSPTHSFNHLLAHSLTPTQRKCFEIKYRGKAVKMNLNGLWAQLIHSSEMRCAHLLMSTMKCQGFHDRKSYNVTWCLTKGKEVVLEVMILKEITCEECYSQCEPHDMSWSLQVEQESGRCSMQEQNKWWDPGIPLLGMLKVLNCSNAWFTMSKQHF